MKLETFILLTRVIFYLSCTTLLLLLLYFSFHAELEVVELLSVFEPHRERVVLVHAFPRFSHFYVFSMHAFGEIVKSFAKIFTCFGTTSKIANIDLFFPTC